MNVMNPNHAEEWAMSSFRIPQRHCYTRLSFERAPAATPTVSKVVRSV